jgi:hypothetical protein
MTKTSVSSGVSPGESRNPVIDSGLQPTESEICFEGVGGDQTAAMSASSIPTGGAPKARRRS